MRAYKTVNDSYIEPISFTVPRRAETFQADIFPPAIGLRPATSAKEWLDGKTGVPAKIDLESVYEGGELKEAAPSDYKPPSPVVPAAAPVAKPEPKKEEPKEEPKPVAARTPPPNLNDQKGSMSTIANKFQDNADEVEETEDTSSFEEISRPVQRSAVRSEPKPVSPPVKTQPLPVRSSPQAKSPTTTQAPVSIPDSNSTDANPETGGVVESSLTQIKELIAKQTKVITAQNDKLGRLTNEVESLKKKISTGSQDQSERIRQLELELEEARS